MVKFGQYFESMVQHKPEWRRAFIDYPTLNKIIKRLKQEVKARELLDPTTGAEPRTYDVFPVVGKKKKRHPRKDGSGGANGGGGDGNNANDNSGDEEDDDDDDEQRRRRRLESHLTNADDEDDSDVFRAAAYDARSPLPGAYQRNQQQQPAVQRHAVPAAAENNGGCSLNNTDDMSDPLLPMGAHPRRQSRPVRVGSRTDGHHHGSGAGPTAVGKSSGRSPHVFTPPASFVLNRMGTTMTTTGHSADFGHGAGHSQHQTGDTPPTGMSMGPPCASSMGGADHGAVASSSPNKMQAQQSSGNWAPRTGPFAHRAGQRGSATTPNQSPAQTPTAGPSPAQLPARPPAAAATDAATDSCEGGGAPNFNTTQVFSNPQSPTRNNSSLVQRRGDGRSQNLQPPGSFHGTPSFVESSSQNHATSSALLNNDSHTAEVLPSRLLNGSVAVDSPPRQQQSAKFDRHDETPPPLLDIHRAPSGLSPTHAGGGGGHHHPTGAEFQSPVTPHALAATKLEYILSLHGRDLAHQFEQLLESETAKTTRWGDKAQHTFQSYVDKNRTSWVEAKNVKKAKFAIRHVYEEIHHLHIFCDTNVLAIKTALKKYGHSQPEGMGEGMDESSLVLPLYDLTARVEALRRDLELFYSKNFGSGGDLRGGIHEIRSTVTTPFVSSMQAFRAGCCFSAFVAIALYWVHVFFELKPTPELRTRFDAAFPVFRLLLSLAFAIVVWSWVLRICASQRINYLYVFELKQTTTMSWMACFEYGMMMLCVATLAGILHLRFDITALPYEDEKSNNLASAAPYMLLTALVIMVVGLALPPRHVFRNTRNAFARVFRRLVVLPFGYVRFIEFFVADWGTSMPQPLWDVMFTVCWYTAASKWAFERDQPNAWHDCTSVTKHWNYPLVAIPYYWRACQTLKMFLRTKNRAHLVNHGKYCTFLIHFAVNWGCAFMEHDTDASRFFIEFFHFAAELYAFVWDVLMDWGFIKGKQRHRMFKMVGIYVAAGIFDGFARFFYLPAEWIKKDMASPEWMVLFQALLEIFRRANWSIFRIENENVNNLETYRSIDFVPEVTLPEAE